MANHGTIELFSPKNWSPRHARHLLNRAGFGVPEARVAELAALSPAEAVSRLLRYRDTPDTIVAPTFLVTQAEYLEYRDKSKTLPEEERRKLNNEFQARERAAVLGLQGWWVERMVNTPRPLQEKMALFWHGHFATSAQKVKSSAANYQLNSVFREHATGNFKALTIAVGQSPAMLRYLDNVQNVKGQPNENWARELMELFTMGVGHYTEDDIKNSARAFTGWGTDNAGHFRFQESRHDFGQKTLFGRTGNFDGWEVIDILFEQPATAEFIAAKLWTYFAHEKPAPDLVTAVAQTLRENDYEIAPLLEAIFLSEAFYSKTAMGTQIKSPIQFLIQLSEHLGQDSPPYLALARASGQLGQQLFYPPNVAGWEGGRTWINANTLLTRYNMSRSMVVADLVAPDEMSMMDMGSMRSEAAKNQRQALQAAMQDLPPAERKAIREKIDAAATPDERKGLVEETIVDLEAGRRWDVRAIFGALEFSNAGECVDALAARYLNAPLSAEQKKVLLAALTPSASPKAELSPGTLSGEEMTSTLHLLFSLAEYQLC